VRLADKRSSPGQPAYDDAEAMKEVRRIRAAHPKWSRTKAALQYAQQHPEEKASVSSVARRLADKIRREDGVPVQRRSKRKRLLERLNKALMAVYLIADELSRLEDEK
jgi:hypothetical protein